MENCVSSAALDAARTRLDAAEAARETILLQHIAGGVIIDSRTVQIAPDVQIAPGAVILAGTILRGHTIIGAGDGFTDIPIVPHPKGFRKVVEKVLRLRKGPLCEGAPAKRVGERPCYATSYPPLQMVLQIHNNYHMHLAQKYNKNFVKKTEKSA